jgi:hypothetical protein
MIDQRWRGRDLGNEPLWQINRLRGSTKTRERKNAGGNAIQKTSRGRHVDIDDFSYDQFKD